MATYIWLFTFKQYTKNPSRNKANHTESFIQKRADLRVFRYSRFQVFSKIKRGVKRKEISCNSNNNITITREFYTFSKPIKTTEYLNTRIPLRPSSAGWKMPETNRLRDFPQSSVCFVNSPFRCVFLVKYIPKCLTSRFWGCIFVVLLLTTDSHRFPLIFLSPLLSSRRPKGERSL